MKKWSEIRKVPEMTRDQWNRFREILIERIDSHGIDNLVATLVQEEPKPRRSDLQRDLERLRVLRNRPHAHTTDSVDKRLTKLLALLAISDPVADAFDQLVYLAVQDD